MYGNLDVDIDNNFKMHEFVWGIRWDAGLEKVSIVIKIQSVENAIWDNTKILLTRLDSH